MWAGLYVAAAYVCVSQLSGLDSLSTRSSQFIVSAFAVCTASAVYLLDRVKLRDAWLDIADAHAHPDRFTFVTTHSTALRAVMFVLLSLAAWLGARFIHWGALIPLLAVVGVHIYAGRPRARKPRPKDIVLIKNLYVALGITGFAVLLSLAASRPSAYLVSLWNVAVDHALPMTLASIHLVLRVFADAALCDLDDAEADRRFGTRTLVGELGRNRAWNIAFAIRVVISVALVFVKCLPFTPRLVWAGITIVSSVTLRIAAPSKVRDVVDARFAFEAVAATVALQLMT